MKRRLSSLLVPLYKLTFFFVLASSIFSLLINFRNFSAPGLLFVSAWLIFLYFTVHRWKSVYLNGGVLLVSNYLKTVEVPISDIVKVEGSSFWGWQPQTVTLKLKSTSLFGDEIIFVPNGGWLDAKSFADELRQNLSLQ